MFRTAASKLAHNSTIPALAGNRDLRPLQDLITAEKGVLLTLQKLSLDIAKSSDALKVWGLGEGDDLGDILNASTALYLHFASALSGFAAHEVSVREIMKSVRTREENLDELRRRRRNLVAKADTAEKKLSRMNPEHKNLQMQTELYHKLKDEIRVLDNDILVEEASVGDFKRTSVRSWMELKFAGLVECCEKGTIVGETGKLVLAEIPMEPTEPGLPRAYYASHPRTELLVSEAQHAISEVVYSADPGFSRPRPAYNPSFPSSPNIPTSPHEYENVSGPSSPHSMNNFTQSPNTMSPSGPSEFGAFSHGQFPSQTTSLHGPESRDPPAPHGGRFSTFPVKGGPRPMSMARPAGTMSPRMGPSSMAPPMMPGDRPPSLDVNGGQDSFASSVAEALHINMHDAEPRAAPVASGSEYNPYAPPPPLYSPPAGPPPGMPPRPANREQVVQPDEGGNGALRIATVIEDAPHEHENSDTELAYVSPTRGTDPDALPPSPDRGDRRVRFGSTRDVDDEMEKRARLSQEQHLNTAAPSTWNIDVNNESAGGNDAGSVAPSTSEVHTSPSVSQEHVPPTSATPPRIPTPSTDEIALHDDNVLNAVAAREVSRELDALMFSSPIQAPTLSARTPSPLLPPNPSFAARPDSQRRSFTDISTARTEPMYIRERDKSLASPTSPLGESTSSQLSSSPTNIGKESPLVRPSLNFSARSPSPQSSSISAGGSYYTPLEHPSPVVTAASFYNIASVSGSSLGPQQAPRTISAAAFKKSQIRSPVLGSEPSVAGATGDTTPLMVKKRTLPNSAAPRLQPPMGGIARVPSAPTMPAQSAAYEPGRRSASTAGTGAEQRVSHYRANDGEEDFDYISAYTDPAPPGQEALDDRRSPPPGYQQGRFSTNLEGDALR